MTKVNAAKNEPYAFKEGDNSFSKNEKESTSSLVAFVWCVHNVGYCHGVVHK
jgi:hypothetical protein